MPTTMSLIAKQTVGVGGAASVTFSNIPQTFTDLKVVMSTRSSGTSGVQIQFNGSTSNRSNIRLYGNGSVTASFSGSDVFTYQNRSSYTANTFDSSEIYIPNYTSSNFKSLSIDNVTETNATAVDMQLQAGLWSQTTAITSLGFVPDSSQTFVEFSEFSLYGISSNTTTQNTSVPYASGGDIIRTDGTFWYHTFLASGTFIPSKNLTCDYLVVAGGAGGGGVGGGGGAGGLRSTVTATGGGGTLETPLSLIANTAYTAQIGAGGGGSLYGDGSSGFLGGNSVFSTITSTGGGFGSAANVVGGTGGSGGGSRNNTAGARTVNQGFVGASWANLGGGGGGAGVAGSVGSGGGTGGNGGNGVATSITGSSVTYAGGGGGGSNSGVGGSVASVGGTGGGGAGGLGATGVNGTANSGGGGGGGGFSGISGFNGGAGGSGIIVVRYAV
jgi:hypothetical protein